MVGRPGGRASGALARRAAATHAREPGRCRLSASRVRRRRHRRRRRRRGDRPRAGRHHAAGRARRGARRRRRRHQQGQHRDPAHRLRRHAGHARVPARRPRLRPAAATTPSATGIPVERTGALLVAWDDERARRAARPDGQGRGATATTRCRLVDADEVYARVPAPRRRRARRARRCPDESIICTWTTNLALATEAVARGVDAAARPPGRRRVRRGGRRHHAAAPTRGDARAPGGSSTPPASAPTTSTGCSATTGFTVTPRRGELHRLRQARPPAGRPRSCCRCRPRAARACSSAPTVYGNVMLGPTAEDLADRPPPARRRDGPRLPAARRARGSCPRLLDEEVTATYAGLRAAIEHDDYLHRRRRRAALRAASAASARPD